MSTTATAAPERVSLRKLLWATLVAIVASLVANGLLRLLALAVLDIPPAFDPLHSLSFVILTVGLLLAAAVTFAVIGRLSRTPVRTFQIVAAVALVLSFVPDIGLLASGAPGATLPGVLVLMLMHVVAWAFTVWAFTRFAVER